MKRFLKTLTLLIVSLFFVVSGVDTALDHLSRSVTQNSFTVYDGQGAAVFAYNGDLSMCKVYAKPGQIAATGFLHRT